MASLRFKFAEHGFKEARSASFWIFQLVFGCIFVVWLVCMFRVRISLLLFVFLCVCMAAWLCIKRENVFKNAMHTTVSNGPK